MMYEPHPQIITDGIEAYERVCLYMPSLAVYIYVVDSRITRRTAVQNGPRHKTALSSTLANKLTDSAHLPFLAVSRPTYSPIIRKTLADSTVISLLHSL